MKLALLNYTEKLFNKTNLDNVSVIAVQHILDTNYTMFEHLFKLGLKPENTYLLGKCYSSNLSVIKKFQHKGVHVHIGSTSFNSHVQYDYFFDQLVNDFIAGIGEKSFGNFKKVLLVDDGGYLCRAANLLKNTKNIIAIEQTSSGYHKVKNLNLKFPLINVARSETKLIYESPCIAKAIVEKLQTKLNKLKLRPQKALMIGAGPVGREIHNLLSKNVESHVYDIRRHFSDFSRKELTKILPNFDLIIGATGDEVINGDMYKYLKKDVVLVSASSSDREFSAVNLRKLLPKTKNCHKDIHINNVRLLNCGFPLNFDGNKNSVPPKYIQLTRALMFLAICLAANNKYERGMNSLDKKYQKMIFSKFNEILLESKS